MKHNISKTKINQIIFYLFYTLFCFWSNGYTQEYQITSDPVIRYSIDRFTNEIYYQNDFTGEIFKTNSTGTYRSLTEFTSLPYFANNTHKAAYIDLHSQFDKDLYLYDFEKDTSYFLTNFGISGGPGLLFSPMDNKIMIIAGKPVYYSFEDKTLHDPGFRIIGADIIWISDTTLVYWNYDNSIYAYDINNFEIDTLVSNEAGDIRGLAYNDALDVIAYSWDINQGENAFINLYYLNSRIDTIVYNYLDNGPNLGFDMYFESLQWIKEYNKLGFIGQIVLNPFSFVYSFDYNTSQTQLYTDFNGDISSKIDLEWLNKDTVLFVSTNGFLYGMDITKPVGVLEDTPNEYDAIVLNITAYPNPFNNNSKFTIDVPSSGTLIFGLYNCLGQYISKIDYGVFSRERIVINWTELTRSEHLSTGIYFVKGVFFANGYTVHKTIKVIYLK